MVKSSDKWWCYVDPLALILNVRICVPNKTTDVLGGFFFRIIFIKQSGRDIYRREIQDFSPIKCAYS